MKAHEYAEALYEVSLNKSDEEVTAVLTRFQTLLEERGHTNLLKTILRELEKIERRRSTSTETLVRVAKEEDATRFSENITRDIHTLGGEDVRTRIVIDETLIGGYEVRAKGQRIDRSHKRSLLTLYNNLITNNV